jgi:ceramide glucosyltransferase
MVPLIAASCAAGYVGLQGLKAIGAALALHQAAHHRPAALPARWMSDVAVLQPILGGDPLLVQVLTDNLLALPDASFVWLLDEDDTVGRATADALAAAYPTHRIRRVLHGPAPDGANPKTFKLAAALPSVEQKVCVVLDDDARLSSPALAQLVGELDFADLVTALPCYRDDGSLGAQLMAQFVNNNAALTYLPLSPLMRPLSINGMCYAIRTDRLRALGGFTPLAYHLADDLALARALHAQGARLYQSTASVEVQTHTPDLAHYRTQMHRWFLFATLLVRSEPPALQCLIAVLHGVPPLLLAGLVCSAVLQPAVAGAGLVLGVLAARAGLLCALQRRLTGRVRHRPLASITAELLQPLHLLHAALYRRIRWRTRLYQVLDNEHFHAV